MLSKYLFIDEDKILRQSQLWNTVIGVLNAVQSVIFMFLIARICGEEDAGIFSLAFSMSYLMTMIGNYGVRNYHSTDVKKIFSYKGYFTHRIVTCAAMILVSVCVIIVRGYPAKKAEIFLLCCIFKCIECFEDVYGGELQRSGRLDIASKLGVIRYVVCLVTVTVTLFVTKDMVISFAAMDIVALAVLVLLIWYAYDKVEINKEQAVNRWTVLFRVCFPLFLSTFFNIYICNASKYAIDRYSTDLIQAHYGMIFMPVFVINLLSNCIYRPHLVELANYWNEVRLKELWEFAIRQMLYVAGICIVVIIGGWLIGIQLLSWFYASDLSSYTIPFVILLMGGGMTALVDFLNNIITVIRKQRILIWIYGIICGLSAVLANAFVKKFGMMGASVAYVMPVMVQAVIMIIYVMVNIRSKRSE